MHKRPLFKKLLERMQEPRKFIQVLLGSRQVGKTTLALEVSKELGKPCHYISADLATLQDLAWIQVQWKMARQMIDPEKGALLILDEVQKIPHWSEVIKSLWDHDSKAKINLSVMILGSSPWLMQKEMSESLAGRFEMIPVSHWSFSEMKESFHFSLDEYLYFGGYPGAAALINQEDPSRWMNYINDSLIEMPISRDILLMTRVNKPALLRRLFQLGCIYSGQILSFSTMLGELQDASNTTTLAHYLDLLSGAGLITGIQKQAVQSIRQKGSSPKLAVYNTALMTAQSTKTFKEAKADPVFWGRLVGSSVGAHLLNSSRGTFIEIFYWRDGNHEVDFVLKKGNSITAIEVKSNSNSFNKSALSHFIAAYKTSKTLLIGESGIKLEDFLLSPIEKFL